MSVFFPRAGSAFQARDQNIETRPQIHGVVLDGESLQPLADAEVSLTGQQGAVTTNLSGTFTFDLSGTGTFYLAAKKQGYVGPRSGGQRFMGYAVVVDRDNPRPDIRLLLFRVNQISGRIFDPELERPVPNLKIVALLAYYRYGERALAPAGKEATTGDDGRFLLTELPPGEYYLEIQPGTGMDESIQLDFSREDIDKVQHGYARAFWPGDSDLGASPPVAVNSGAQLDTGDIQLSKRPIYNLHVSMHSATCEPDEQATVMLSQVGGGLRILRAKGQVPCDKEFLIPGLRSGSYRLDAWMQGGEGEHREMGSANVEVADRNVPLDIQLQRGVEISGKARVESAFPQPLPGGLSVLLTPARGTDFAGDSRAPVGTDGTFRLVNIELSDQRVKVDGLGKRLYLKEINYNGSAVSDGILRLNPVSQSQSLEVVLGDKPATIKGQVTDRDQPVSGAHVVLVKWPLDLQNVHFVAITSDADAKGQFQFEGLAPGEYRIFAVSPLVKDKLEQPNILEWMVGKARTVELSEGGAENVPLEASEP